MLKKNKKDIIHLKYNLLKTYLNLFSQKNKRSLRDAKNYYSLYAIISLFLIQKINKKFNNKSSLYNKTKLLSIMQIKNLKKKNFLLTLRKKKKKNKILILIKKKLFFYRIRRQYELSFLKLLTPYILLNQKRNIKLNIIRDNAVTKLLQKDIVKKESKYLGISFSKKNNKIMKKIYKRKKKQNKKKKKKYFKICLKIIKYKKLIEKKNFTFQQHFDIKSKIYKKTEKLNEINFILMMYYNSKEKDLTKFKFIKNIIKNIQYKNPLNLKKNFSNKKIIIKRLKRIKFKHYIKKLIKQRKKKKKKITKSFKYVFYRKNKKKSKKTLRYFLTSSRRLIRNRFRTKQRKKRKNLIFLIKYRLLKLATKDINFIKLKLAIKNIFISFFRRLKGLFLKVTCGYYGYTGAKKATTFAYEHTALNIAKLYYKQYYITMLYKNTRDRLIGQRKKRKACIVYYYTKPLFFNLQHHIHRRQVRSIIKGFKKAKLGISFLSYNPKTAHNGLWLRKKKRV